MGRDKGEGEGTDLLESNDDLLVKRLFVFELLVDGRQLSLEVEDPSVLLLTLLLQ